MDSLFLILLLLVDSKVAVGAILAAFLSEFFKYIVKCILGENELTKRPKNHGKCGSSTINQIGMPSGHSLVAGYLFAQTDSQLRWVLLAIPLSRVTNGCHTILQVIIGFIMGIIFSRYFYK